MPSETASAPPLDPQACYAALKARDARFDGRFFVGVSSTGIYCRPICRVRTPRPDHCTFHATAAAAEAAGFRPCLRCRPELAPGRSPAEAGSRLALRAARLLEEDGWADRNLADLAGRLGVTDRHLRRLFRAEYGVAPRDYLRTRRLLLAKNLLTDTRLSVTEVAMGAGFGSLRRFNEAFSEHYRLTPGDLRRAGGAPAGQEGEVSLLLGYSPPYDWESLIAFLAGRTIRGVESVADGVYRRTVGLRSQGRLHRGWLAVRHRPEKNAVLVTLAPELLPALAPVLTRLRRLFDLDSRPLEIFDRLRAMNDLAPDLARPGTRLPGCFDAFEMAARAIVGQQITVKAAATLAGRLAETFGEPLTTPWPELTVTFPGPERFRALSPPIEDHLGPLGLIGSRARSLLALAAALAEGRLTLSPAADPEAEMARLAELPGFGPWTVHYLAMRGLSWPDAFPHTDYGVKKALPGLSEKQILAAAEAWRPWRSYAVINLWNSLK